MKHLKVAGFEVIGDRTGPPKARLIYSGLRAALGASLQLYDKRTEEVSEMRWQHDPGLRAGLPRPRHSVCGQLA